MPKVSVIVPNYNHSKYLKQRIESILFQSYSDFEVIILDDLSTDNSREVIEEYRNNEKVSSIVFNTKNSGSTFKQWAKGISMAKGDYIWIAESDDWCEPTLLQELVSGIEKDQECLLSYCQSYCIINTNIVSWQTSHPLLSEIVDGRQFIKKYMSVNNAIYNASMVLWKREIFQSLPSEFLEYKFCGDWLFWIEIAKRGKVHISGKLLNYFRKHDRDVSGIAEKTGLNYIEIMKLINTLYNDGIINEPEYSRAYKHHFRAFLREKHNLDFNTSAQITNLFKRPLSPKTSYHKNLIKALWRGYFRK